MQVVQMSQFFHPYHRTWAMSSIPRDGPFPPRLGFKPCCFRHGRPSNLSSGPRCEGFNRSCTSCYCPPSPFEEEVRCCFTHIT